MRARRYTFVGVIALISVVPKFMQERPVAGNSEAHLADKQFQPVTVTEFRISASPKTIIVGHDSPNIGDICESVGKHGCDVSGRFCSGRQDDIPFDQITNWKAIIATWVKFGVFRRSVFSQQTIRPDSAVPAHISRGQMANVVEGHGAHQTITSIVVRHEAARLCTDVGPLKNLSIARLIPNAAPSEKHETNGRERQHASEANKPKGEIGNGIAIRPFPKPVIFAFLSGAFIGCVIVCWAVLGGKNKR